MKAHDRETVKALRNLERDLAVLLSGLGQYPQAKRQQLLSKIQQDASAEAASLGLDHDDVKVFVNRVCVAPPEEDRSSGLELGGL